MKKILCVFFSINKYTKLFISCLNNIGSTVRRMAINMTSILSMMQSSAKLEDDIWSVFASLSGDDMNKPLEPRIAQLK
jgi:hypothetical protein